MATPKRYCKENTTYHIFTRCIEAKSLMQSHKVKQIIIDVLNSVLENYEFDLNLYGFMDNHLHLIIKTKDGGPSISTIMQMVKSQIAKKYNKLHNRIGPFWNERFGDSVVDLSNDPVFVFKWLTWYIGYNPVRAGLSKNPRNYPFCSINNMLDETAEFPIKLTFNNYYLKLGENFNERLKSLEEVEEIYIKRLYDVNHLF